MKVYVKDKFKNKVKKLSSEQQQKLYEIAKTQGKLIPGLTKDTLGGILMDITELDIQKV